MIQPSKDKSKILYDAVSKDYDIGTYDDFKSKLQDPLKRKAFYDGVGTEYQLGTYEEFESKIGEPVKKKESTSQRPSSESNSATTSSAVSKFKKQPFELKPETTEVVVESTNIAPPRRVTTDAKKLQQESDDFERLQKAELQKYRQATALTDLDDNEAKDELSALKKEEGIWNTITAKAAQLGNYITKGTFSKDNPMKSELEQAKLQLKEQGVDKPNAQQLSEKADEIFLNNKREFQRQQKATQYLENLNPITKGYLELDAKDAFKSLSKESNDITDRIKMNEKAGLDLIKMLEDPNVSIEQKQALQSDLVEVAKQMDDDFKLYSKTQRELGTVQDEFDAFKRNYDAIGNFGSRAAASIANLGVDIYSGANYIANTLGAGEEDRQKGIANARDAIAAYQSGFRPENTEITADNFFQYATDLIGGQTGTILALSTGGAAGGATLLGMGSAGEKYSEMYNENLKNKERFTPAQMATAPFVSWVSESVFSSFPTVKTLANTKRLFMAAAKDETKKELVETAVQQTARKILERAGRDLGKEVLTEEINNVVQNAVNKDILGDKSVGYFDNAEKVLLDTALMTSFISTAPHIAMAGVKAFTPTAKNTQLDKNGKKIIALSKQLDNDLEPETRKAVEQQISATTKESAKIVDETIKNLGEMNEVDVKRVLDSSKKMESISEKAEVIKNDPSLDTDAKKAVLSSMKEEYQYLQEKTQDIIDGKDRTEIKETEAKPNEAKAAVDIAPDADIRPDIGMEGQQRQDNDVQSAVDTQSNQDEVKTVFDADYLFPLEDFPEEESIEAYDTESDFNYEQKINFAKSQIEKGVTLWKGRGDVGSPRIKLGIEWADIRKAEKDIAAGKYNTAPATKLINAMDEARKNGGYEYVQGMGGVQATQFVPLGKKIKETELTEDELAFLNENADALAREWDAYFDTLSEDEQQQIIEGYEGSESTIEEENGQDTEATKSEMDVEPEKTASQESGNGQPPTGQVENEGSFERKSGKKSLLNRANQGNDKRLSKAVEKYGLDYEVENQEQAKKNAESFVDEVGVESAIDAVRSGKIKGAEKAFIYSKVISDITESLESVDEAEQSELEQLHVDILGMIADEFDQDTRDAARFISALNNVYNSSNGRYNLSKQVKDYKARGDGRISEEMLKKFTENDIYIKQLEKERVELQKERDELVSRLDAQDVLDELTKNTKLTRTSRRAAANNIANKIRQAKIHKPDVFSAASPASLVWDGAIEIIARSIEAGGSLADAIEKGISHIKKTKWYKSLSNEKKSEAEGALTDWVNQKSTTPKYSIDSKGKLRISQSFLVDLVKSGLKDIDEVSQAVLDEIKKDIPDTDLTVRDVRDAITDYGRTINPTKDEILLELGKMKILGRLISGLEDAGEGIRPKRTGLLRPEPTLEERRMQRELREALRDLPLDEADMERSWKTALDSIKKRLQNQIEELDKQIEIGEKRKPEKNPVEYDAEAKQLQSIRDEKKRILDELVGKPELTDEQKIKRAENALNSQIGRLEEQIASNDVSYKKKPTPVTSEKLESLRKRKAELNEVVKAMREESGIVEQKRLEAAKTYRKNKIAELNRRLQEKDFSQKIRKELPIDKELLDLDGKLQEAKDVYEKEKYVLELKNRDAFQKFTDWAVNLFGLARLFKAGGEFSVVLSQMGLMTPELIFDDIVNAVKGNKEDAKSIKAFGRLFTAFALPDAAKRFETEMKTSELSPLMKKAKLAITGTDHKLDAQEENFQVDMATNAWNKLGDVLGEREVLTPMGKIKELMGKELSESDKKAIGQQFKENAPWKVFERGAVSYSNYVKMVKFQQGVEQLQARGYDPINDIDQYKKLAEYVNVFSGRASLGQLEQFSKGLSLLFFSARFAYSQFQQLNPFFYIYSLGSKEQWQAIKSADSFADLKKIKPTVAQKMAVTSFMKSTILYATFVSGFVAMANLGKDDDDEKYTIETDPRSSDFAKIKKGKTNFGGYPFNTLLVLYMRLLTQEYKTKKGEIKTLGKGYGTPTSSELGGRYIANKLSPAMGFIWRYGLTHPETDPKTGKEYRVDAFGNVFGNEELLDLMVPIYYGSIYEIQQEDPDTYQQFLTSLGLLGMNVGADKESQKFKDLIGDTKKGRKRRQSRRERNKKPE